MLQVVGISDMKTSANGEDVLVTYSLGSCVGVALYDPVARIGGMVHCMLPTSKSDPEKAQANPYMFTDTGVAVLLQEIYNMGARRDRIVAKVAGASNLLDDKGLFKIGERNYTVLRKILWKNEILIKSEDVGGTKARTLYLHIADGTTLVKSAGQEVIL